MNLDNDGRPARALVGRLKDPIDADHTFARCIARFFVTVFSETPRSHTEIITRLINQPQDYFEQVTGHCRLGKLDGDIATMP